MANEFKLGSSEDMQFVFIESMSGTSKAGNPYNMIKVASPKTFENHVVSYDPAYLQSVQFRKGTLVELYGTLSTPYQNTGFVVTGIKEVAK